MRRVMQYAKRIFLIRDCNKRLPLGKPMRPCVNYEMGRCSGACAGKISEKEYRSTIDMLARFLNGRRKDLVSEFEAAMECAATELQFEEAALLRDQVRLIKDASRAQQVDLKVPDAECDVFGLYTGDRTLCLAVLHVREGLLISSRNFAFDKTAWESSREGAEALLLQYYLDSGETPPDEILVCEEGGIDPGLASQAFASQFSKKVDVGVPQKGPKRFLCDIAIKNARLFLMQKLPPNALLDLQDMQSLFNLPKFPHVIEAFDVSNFGETNAVAGMVRFTDGQPDKSGYRRYKIKTVSGQNDFAMMMEAVARRLMRQKERASSSPISILSTAGSASCTLQWSRCVSSSIRPW